MVAVVASIRPALRLLWVALPLCVASCGSEGSTGGGGMGGHGYGGAGAFEKSECGACVLSACAPAITSCQSDAACTTYLDCLWHCPLAEDGNVDPECEGHCPTPPTSDGDN